ncbi:alpha/beta hydrolase [Corynebacterium hindlerae]|uniref:alpha/beta fold hydrolase n=1 Tax=Corynebacterium hindlerae TaxID=699041 RepID=UPI001AD76F9B|nr:alpha/beta hydrolase [Corynebacterium hindlerae]QTH59212.1 alpha/beta hydrolase [Corynebacterium hindlerae]
MPKLRALDFRSAPFAPRYYDSDPEGPETGAIVLLHGTFGSTASHFGLVFPELARHHRVIGLDFQPVQQELTVSQLVEQTRQLIDGLGLQRPVIVGYSLGAVVAAAFAGTHPELLSQLVVLAGWARSDQQQHARNDLWFRLRETDEDALRTFTVLSVFGPEFIAWMSPRQLEASRKSLVFSAFGEAQMRLNRSVDISALLPSITAETLVLSCTQDAMVPPHHQQQLTAALADAHLRYLHGGHGIVFEDPDAVVREILEFLA